MTADQRVLALLGMASFSSMASMRVCDAMLPVLAADFAVSTGQAARAVSAFAVSYGVAQVFFGPMGDRFGKFKVITFATLACTVGAVVAAISPNLEWLTTSRLLSGAAAAGIIPLTMAWVGDNVAYSGRQEMLARLLSFTVVGMIAGQWLGGVLADQVGWRSAFGALSILFASTAALLGLAARRMQSCQGRMAAVSPFGRYLSVLSVPWARVILLITFIEGALVFSAIAFIASYLHGKFGISMSMAGATLAFYGVGGFIYSRNARRLVTALGEGGLAILGGSALMLAFGSLVVIPVWQFALPACLLAGFGFYAMHNTLQTHATQMAPAARGTAMSAFSCVLFLGQSLGMLVAASLVDHFSTTAVFASSSAGLIILSAAFAFMLRWHRAQTVLAPISAARS